jgi:probable phosphoglycerate mutase
MIVLLARHGETDANAERRIQGRGLDTDLNARGRAQAGRLADHLADVPLGAVYTSALRRTHQTAAPLLARRPDLRATALADLDEMSWGVHEGQMGGVALSEVYRQTVAQWNAGALDERVEGGESPREVERRARRALRAIQAAHASGTVLVVTHGRTLRVLLGSLLPAYGLTRMQELTHPNASLTEVELAPDGAARLVRLASTDHLDGL